MQSKLTALFLLTLGNGAILAGSSAQQDNAKSNMTQPVMMSMPMAAPFFVESESAHNILTLVVNNSDATDVDVVISDFVGNTISKFTESVPAHGRISLPLRDKLADLLPVQGSITVSAKQRATVGAQLSMSIDGPGASPSDLEEEFFMPDTSLKNTFQSIGLNISEEPITALRSLSSSAQKVVITCVDEAATVTSHSLVLGPGSTIHVRGCSGATVAFSTGSPLRKRDPSAKRIHTVGISVSSDGMPGELAVYGFASVTGGYESLPFIQGTPGQPYSSVFAGTPISSLPELGGAIFEPQVGLSNFGSGVKSAEIFYSSGAQKSQQLVTSVKIAPHSSLKVPLPRFSGTEALGNSFLITTDDSDGQLVSRLRSVSTRDEAISVEIPAEDRDKTYNGGQHPWRVDPSYHSNLILFNADADPQPVDIDVYTGSAVWESHITVKPFETRVFDIASLIESGGKDAQRHKLPRGALDGIITWSSLATNGIFGRLMVTDSTRLFAQNFSCYTVTMTCGAQIGNPAESTIGFNNGEVESLTGYANTCPGTKGICECNGSGSCTGSIGTASSYAWNSSNSSIASITNNTQNSQTASVSGNSPGTTRLQLTANGPYCSGSTQSSVEVANCPSTLLLGQTYTISLNANDPPYKTGMGIFATMMASAGHDGAQIKESLSLQSSTCGPNYQIDCGDGLLPFTIGPPNGGLQQGVNLPQVDNAFYDEHEDLNTTDVLGSLGESSCTFTCIQTYSCNGNPIGKFAIQFNLAHGNGVTNVTAQKTASN